MATKLGLFPLEVWETVLEHFVLTVDPRNKNRSAILSVCSAWHQIAEPLMYQHVVILESSDQLEGLRSLAETVNRYPNYASRVKSLTVQFSASRLWDELPDDEVVERFGFLEWMQEMKSLSIGIDTSHKQHADGARWLADEVMKKVPPTCQSLELRLKCTDYNILSYENYPVTKIVHIPTNIRNLRLEALCDPWDAVYRLSRGDFKRLKKVVIKSDRLSHRTTRVSRDMAKYSRYVISAVINGSIPALERMLLYDQKKLNDDSTIDSDIKDCLTHVRTLTYKDLYEMLLIEGTDEQMKKLLEISKSGLSRDYTASEDWENTPVGNKWLLYKTRSKEENLLGTMYTFAAYPFSYQLLENRGVFSWCSTTNGVRMPVSYIANSELTRSSREIKQKRGISIAESVEQRAAYRRWTNEPRGWLSGVLFKSCKDLDIALHD